MKKISIPEQWFWVKRGNAQIRESAGQKKRRKAMVMF